MNENTMTCKSIALELEAVANGNCYKCPECGEVIRWDDAQYDDDTETYTCPHCDHCMDECELEAYTLLDHLGDVYDIEYRIGANKQYRSVKLMVACGGPNIYIDTAARVVSLHWWTEHAEYSIDTDTCAAIDAEFEMLFECC